MSASANHMDYAVSVSSKSGTGSSGRRRRAVVVGSLGYSLVNFRLDLMRRFQANGYEVTAFAAEIALGLFHIFVVVVRLVVCKFFAKSLAIKLFAAGSWTFFSLHCSHFFAYWSALLW